MSVVELRAMGKASLAGAATAAAPPFADTYSRRRVVELAREVEAWRTGRGRDMNMPLDTWLAVQIGLLSENVLGLAEGEGWEQ